MRERARTRARRAIIEKEEEGGRERESSRERGRERERERLCKKERARSCVLEKQKERARDGVYVRENTLTQDPDVQVSTITIS